jgi:hypothetical protein
VVLAATIALQRFHQSCPRWLLSDLRHVADAVYYQECKLNIQAKVMSQSSKYHPKLKRLHSFFLLSRFGVFTLMGQTQKKLDKLDSSGRSNAANIKSHFSLLLDETMQ